MSGVPYRQDRAAAAVPQVADDFLRLLTESGVLRPTDIRDAIQRYDLHCKPSPSAVACTLVTEGLVTQFQANRLLHGRRHGLVIDGYKLLYVLGSGGMGLVYAAEEIETGFKVALKVVSRHHRHDIGMLARFRLEAQAGMSLAHPNILRTFGIKRTEDAYGETEYVVMEYVRGVNLLELIALEKQIPWPQAADIIMQAAVGLEYAHKKKLVHRDVKPENLLIRSDGTVKILDFGLAMLDENDEEFAMAMILGQDRLGTADYVAPEQSVDSYRVDERADIYSLGCTLYFALAGQVPFPVESPAEKIACHRKQRPQSIREIRPEIPERLELILRKMMAKRPDHRVASATEVIRYLKPFSKRQAVDFDFERVLRARAKQAEKRIIEQLGRRRATDKTPSPKPAQANVETNVRQDTNLDSKGRGSRPG